MSSGEQAKPPFEERNPFDIARRSGPEVAAEIAKRMSAWKQARARTTAPSTTIPGSEAKGLGGQSKLPSSAPSTPIAAPVQPARMPAPARNANSTAPRVPYFASASATRRAMPPAPSLKQGTRPMALADDGTAGDSAIPVVAPTLERDTPRHDDPAKSLDAATPIAATENPPQAEPPSDSAEPVEAAVAETSARVVDESDDTERQRAEARAIKARWMAAHDLDALLDIAAADQAAGAVPDTGSGENAGQPQATAEDSGDGEAHQPDQALRDAPAAPEQDIARATAAAEHPAPTHAPAAAAAGVTTETAINFAALDEVGHKTFGAPATAGTTENVIAASREPAEEPHAHPVASAAADATDVREGGDAAPGDQAPRDDSLSDESLGDEAPSIAVLDEIAGRKEPTFDPPAAQAVEPAPPLPMADPTPEPRAPIEAVTHDLAPADNPLKAPELSIAALDEAAGRKEPTFDPPVGREPPVRPASGTPEAQGPVEPTAARSAVPVFAVTDDDRAVAEPAELGIAAFDERAVRKEPTFDQPLRPAKPDAAPAAPRIKLRPIETRIEARRIDTLRADPQLSARRPLFPHIEPEEWDVPPEIAARANRDRRGTGWAIALGSVLLLAGITAPAAIWQQGRHADEQVAQVSLPPAATTAAAPAQATVPQAPQPEAAPAASADAGAPPAQQKNPQPAAPAEARTAQSEESTTKSEDRQAADAKPATALGAIKEGGEVNAAPVKAPPPPSVNLASKSEPAEEATPMVARPFVPQGGDGPFLRAPTTGETSVPVAGAPSQSVVVGAKPRLMVQLKPAAKSVAAKPVPSKQRPVTRKPRPFFQQSPDQMFQTLIDTLSEGKPVNPATKPVSPSNRR